MLEWHETKLDEVLDAGTDQEAAAIIKERLPVLKGDITRALDRLSMVDIAEMEYLFPVSIKKNMTDPERERMHLALNQIEKMENTNDLGWMRHVYTSRFQSARTWYELSAKRLGKFPAREYHDDVLKRITGSSGTFEMGDIVDLLKGDLPESLAPNFHDTGMKNHHHDRIFTRINKEDDPLDYIPYEPHKLRNFLMHEIVGRGVKDAPDARRMKRVLSKKSRYIRDKVAAPVFLDVFPVEMGKVFCNASFIKNYKGKEDSRAFATQAFEQFKDVRLSSIKKVDDKRETVAIASCIYQFLPEIGETRSRKYWTFTDEQMDALVKEMDGAYFPSHHRRESISTLKETLKQRGF